MRNQYAEIMIVGHDDSDPEQAVMLREAVNRAGLKWDELLITEVIDAHRVLGFIDGAPSVRVVVLLGNDAMKEMTKKSGITKHRGEEINLPGDTIVAGNFRVPNRVTFLPTLHPTYVVKRRAFRPVLVQDLVRAKKLAAGAPMLDPAQEVRFLPDGSAPYMMVGTSSDIMSVDVETDEFDKPRLLALGNTPAYVTVLSATAAPAQAVWGLNHTWVGHHLRADELWLRQLGITLKGEKQDTMLMAHLLNENRSMSLKKLSLELLDPHLYWQYVQPLLHKPDLRGAIDYNVLGTYCANDVAATLLIYDALSQQMNQPENLRLKKIYEHMSLPLSDVLQEMEWHGVPFDMHGAAVLRGTYNLNRDLMANDMSSLLGKTGVNYGSHPQVRKILYEELGLTPPHLTETGQGSTDDKALMKLRDEHEFVKMMRMWRRWDKKDQIVESWMKRADVNHIVHPRYNQTGTVTGRLSGSDPNPQNVPTDPEIRGLIVAPPGHQIVSADYKTIEMGCAAWIFQEPSLLAAYTEQMEGGEDLHTKTATALLGRPPKDKDERKKYGKTPNFGLLYQQGDKGYREYAAKNGVEMTLEEAAQMRAAWHALYPGVRDGWRRIGNLMHSHGGTLTAPSGRMRRLPEFMSRNKMLQNEAWRQGCNFPVQCTAGEFTHVAAILSHRLSSQYGARLVLHVHDSLVFIVEDKWVQAWSEVLTSTMEDAVPAYFETMLGTAVPIPLRVDITTGRRWS